MEYHRAVDEDKVRDTIEGWCMMAPILVVGMGVAFTVLGAGIFGR